MEFLLDVRFEDKGYNASVNLVTPFFANNAQEAQDFVLELRASLQRHDLEIFSVNYLRIDNDSSLRSSLLKYYQFYKSIATATVSIEQFRLEKPDQAKSLTENLMDKMFSGEESTARIGNKYDLPVRVLDKETRNTIRGDIYYLNLEHLIPE